MRTPWREALDGKIRVIRDLRADTSAESMEAYFSESPQLRALVGEKRLKDAALQMAVQYADATRAGVQRAEPFWVWDSITNGIQDRFESAERAAIATTPFRMTDLPVREGLIWFQQPCHISQEAEGPDSAWVRAIFFGEAQSLAAKPGERIRFATEYDCLGIVVFLDSAKSDFVSVKENRPFLLPWICNAVKDGQNLHEYGSIVRRNAPDLAPTDFRLSIWPVAFCLEFFRLLQQRLLRYGGSGVEREARKEARRHGLEPTVQVVEWRKAEYHYPAGYEPKFVAWTCRWPSREHTRRLKSGRVIRVAASIKGPKDKPLKLGRERVNVVKH